MLLRTSIRRWVARGSITMLAALALPAGTLAAVTAAQAAPSPAHSHGE